MFPKQSILFNISLYNILDLNPENGQQVENEQKENHEDVKNENIDHKE